MTAVDFWPKLVLAVLMTWRLTHLLVREDGPFQWGARLRMTLGDSPWGQMFHCFYCMSLWVAAPLSLWFGGSLLEHMVVCLALSGAACLCERVGQPQVTMHSMPNTAPDAVPTASNEGERHELLRTRP